ncbi:MAG: FAD-dependent monooxygenase, partial [Kutzneria sp.]|nr:FAD-dependent monooxygenase [Kutzneria sp.]
RVRTDGDVLHCRYLVGCDGGRSTVRKVAGFPFPGTDPTVTCRQGIVTMEGSEDLPTGWNHTPTGLFVHGPGPRLMVVEFDGPPADRDEPVTHEDMQDSLFRVSGVQVRITRSKWLSRFTDNTRLATTYRDGRVLLAGDAAHVHAPWGGQGLNLGIQDAVNLGWKLAATVNGWAPEDLLDTYTAERRPVAARVLDNTRAQQALMRPGPHATAVRELFSDLMDYEPVRRHLGELIGFTDVRYDPRIPDADDLVGRYTPDRVDLSRGRAVLVGPAELDRLAAGWADRVERRSDAGSGRGLLIRPDGYVAWAGDAAGKGLDDALVTWFGRPDQ